MRPELFEYAKTEVLTNQKPTVVYFDESYDFISNKDICISALKKDLGCQVAVSSYPDFSKHKKEIDFLSKSGSIVAFIIKEDKFDSENPNYPNKIIKNIRNISADTPIVLIKHEHSKRKYQKLIDTGTISLSSFYCEGINFVKKSLEKFSPKPSYFGVETYNAIEPAVRNIYKSRQSEENEIYLTDDQVTCHAFRLRLLNNGEIIKNVFDSNLGQSPNPQELDISREIIQKEKEIIRQLSSHERREFASKVYQSIYFDRQGRRLPFLDGRGDTTNGFAIDPETLEFNITTGYGEHDYAERKLTLCLVSMNEFRGDINAIAKEEEIENRLMSGSIYQNVSGFSSPILILEHYYDSDNGEYGKVVNFLNKQNFITISALGRLIE